MFYRLVWNNLQFKGKKILDFGSGFGVSSNHLAESNDVTAVEPNEEMLKHRLLKKDGVLSIVKHNKAGKIMHKAVFENNTEEAMALINGEMATSQNFGTINEYSQMCLKKHRSGKKRCMSWSVQWRVIRYIPVSRFFSI